MTGTALHGAKVSPSEPARRAPGLGRDRPGRERCGINGAEARKGPSRTLRSNTRTSKLGAPAASGRPGRHTLPAAHPSSALASSDSGKGRAAAELRRQAPGSGETRIVRWRPMILSDASACGASAEGCSPIASGPAARRAANAGAALLGGTDPKRRCDRLSAQGNSALADAHGRISSEPHGHPAMHGQSGPSLMPAPFVRRGSMG